MGRTEAKSGQAAKRPMAATSGASLPRDVSVLSIVHTQAIVIGRVRRVLVGDGSGALIRWRGAYDQVGWSKDEIARAVGLSNAAVR